jgi:type IV pilus assembly protein PilM
MAIQPGVWGIDLGQCALKAIRVEEIDGVMTATAFDYVEHPKILSQPDADPDELTREALQKFLSRNSIKGDLVAISIPGQSGLARFVKLPPVEEKKIPDIVRFEAKQQIPFNLEEVVWDYQKLNTGVVTDGFAMETEIGLFAIKRDTVNRYLQHFKDVNVEVQIVQMAPLALCNYVSYDLLEAGAEGGKKRCVVALDIGADNSNLVITDGERIIWQRPIPLGGNHFTRALTKDMKLTFAKAEHLKRNATKSPDLKQILSSLKPVLNDFVGEVQRSLGYFTNTHRDATVQYMMGLGNAFRLPGLQKFLGEKLQLEVRKLQQLERLTGDEVVKSPVYTENVLSFAVAYGLALQGMKLARLHTNLLPQEIRTERMIRAKKPWAITAAAALLLSAGVLAFGYDRQHVAVADDSVKGKMKEADGVVTKAKGFDSAVENVKKKIEDDKNAVKSVVFGQEERLNWIKLNQFLNTALPRPDGSNLSEAASLDPNDKRSPKKRYWTPLARQAYDKFLAFEKGSKGSERLDEEEWRDNLIQANIESVYCVYCQDLASYFTNLKGIDQFYFRTMREKDQKNPPTGKGWVIELDGSTYFNPSAASGDNQFRFVSEVIVGNLARLPVNEKAEGTAEGSGANAQNPAPAAPAANATQPAAPATPPASEGGEPAKDNPGDPITNKVSHVILYQLTTDSDPQPGVFHLIEGGHVADGLIQGSAAAMSAPGGMGGGGDMPTMMKGGARGMMGGGGGGGSDWAPLGTTGGGSGGASGGGGKFGMGTAPPPPGVGPGAAGGGRKMMGFAAAAGPPASRGSMGMEGFVKKGAGLAGGLMPQARVPTPSESTTKKKKGGHVRTEFQILLIWNEPTPSDKLLPAKFAADASTAQQN